MGLLVRLAERRASPENPKTSLANPDEWLIDIFAGPETAAGVRVNEKSALASTAVFGAIRVLAETIGSLPLIVYERLDPRGKRRASDHRLFPILHDQANPEMTAVMFRETLTGHMVSWGNAYAEIEYDHASRVVALWPLLPDRTYPQRVNGRKVFITHVNGTPVPLADDRVLHIAGLGYDGLVGYSPIFLARQAIALALATEEFGARYFGNGARPGGALKHKGRLDQPTHDRLKASWAAAHQGLTNSQRVAILEEGMEWQSIGVPPEDSQFLETRKFQVNEISRIFRVPPHMLADLERATFSNIEHQGIEFVVHTLRPWLVRWEQTLLAKLFGVRGRNFAEFLVDGLLRGDIVSRYNAYAVGRNGGWLSSDDIRDMENMNPLGPEKGGDIYLVPLNMVPADKVGELSGQPVAPPTDADEEMQARWRKVLDGVGQRLRGVYEPLFQGAVARLLAFETRQITQRQRKGQATPEWLTTFYAERVQVAVRELEPLFRAYAVALGLKEAEPFISEYVRSFVGREITDTVNAVRDRLTASDWDVWESTRAAEMAERAVEHGGAAFVSLLTPGGSDEHREAA